MTDIEWTHPPGYKGESWNPATGCTKVSQGCKHCYAETVALRFWGERKFSDVKTYPERLAKPLRWRDPRCVFVNSMSDLFHEDIPFEFIAAVFGVMAVAPRHRFIVLTKRPARALEFFEWLRPIASMPADDLAVRLCIGAMDPLVQRIEHVEYPAWPLPNVILGVSVENQPTADERIPLVLQLPAVCLAVSYEPALGPVDFRRKWLPKPGEKDAYQTDTSKIGHRYYRDASHLISGPRIGWVICGGESGVGARPCELGWLRDTVEACRFSIPCFVKQLGSEPRHDCSRGDPDGSYEECLVRSRVQDRKGSDPDEWPEDLRVRQWPDVLRSP